MSKKSVGVKRHRRKKYCVKSHTVKSYRRHKAKRKKKTKSVKKSPNIIKIFKGSKPLKSIKVGGNVPASKIKVFLAKSGKGRKRRLGPKRISM